MKYLKNSTVNKLQVAAVQVFVADVSPDKSRIKFESIDFVEW